MNKFILLLFFVNFEIIHAQPVSRRYFVSFTDKLNSPYRIDEPGTFLSQKTILRRQHRNIPVTGHDLPVNESYIRGVLAAGTAMICKIKQLNGIVIETVDSAALQGISAMQFVESVSLIYDPSGSSATLNKWMPETGCSPFLVEKNLARTSSLNYGSGRNQIEMINGDFLHDQGFKGSGITIAVLDAGFFEVNSLDAFQNIVTNNQILGTWDFVNNEPEVFSDDSHGMSVLSCIAADLPGQLIGTAPGASFFLLRTEDVFSETLAEEYYWAAAVEYADSAGADIITTSVGYTKFDDSSQNHSYTDMNGHTTVAALAANHAASLGMLVIASAGNLGATSWNYISTPADADSAMAVGGVNAAGGYATFSSNGPSSDGDIKPNVATQGQGTSIAYPGNFIGQGSGTSFSAPVLAGAAACLWQAHPASSNMEIFEAIQKSSSQFTSPDTLLGYGIPDFRTADFLLTEVFLPEGIVNVFPNPFNEEISIDYSSLSASGNLSMALYNILGQEVYSGEIKIHYGLQTINIHTGVLSKGMYILSARSNNNQFNRVVTRN